MTVFNLANSAALVICRFLKAFHLLLMFAKVTSPGVQILIGLKDSEFIEWLTHTIRMQTCLHTRSLAIVAHNIF